MEKIIEDKSTLKMKRDIESLGREVSPPFNDYRSKYLLNPLVVISGADW